MCSCSGEVVADCYTLFTFTLPRTFFAYHVPFATGNKRPADDVNFKYVSDICHSSFLQAGCPSCRPTNSIKALKVVGCWRGYLSGARCRLAYGPADATATHCLFASVKSRLVLPFWYRLTRVVPEKWPLNVCVCVCVCVCK